MAEKYKPQASDKFTFGLWTVGNVGRDPFGEPVRRALSPVEIVQLLAEVGAWGVNLHDNDLVPIDATAQERDRIVADFRRALQESGLVVPMATTNLFSDPAFRDGAFTSNDPQVRAYALQKTMRAIDLGVELGAAIYVFWGGREGTETDAGKDPLQAGRWFREALNFLCAYVQDQGYDLKFALEPKPNEPRGDIYLATTGAMLGFIETLDHPEMVGVNPEVAHEHMAGLNFTHHVAQAWDAGKLWHIDLNDQAFGRYDQDFRFGSVNRQADVAVLQVAQATVHELGRLGRRAGREVVALDQRGAQATGGGVEGDARAGDAATDDEHVVGAGAEAGEVLVAVEGAEGHGRAAPGGRGEPNGAVPPSAGRSDLVVVRDASR